MIGFGEPGSITDSLNSSASLATDIGKSLVQAGVSGKGTPFQQAAIKSYTSSASRNMLAYEKQAGVNDAGAGGIASILQSANAMLGSFADTDVKIGSGFLSSAIQSSYEAQKIEQSQDQMFGQALGSAAEITLMIMMM